ncbi:MAG: glycosyltransferase [Methylacidiphilales bacterium]|nr:glycosyltransferase [Candidatus Methylacidiphilales bacterium]NJR17743.1 glycosyltransferase [Calothrix sp. CSU_2_0]
MKKPLFSIIIPTYNRPERLTKCIQSLTRLEYPHDDFEVIVVDDGSSQPLDDVVAIFTTQINLTIIRQANSGPASARNRGAKSAQGKYLVFTDDDCTIAPEYLTKLKISLDKTPNVMIGGRTLNALSDNLYSSASQILIDYLYEYYNTNSSQPNFFASNNFALPAEIFNSLGGFDTNFPLAAGEDREFCDRFLHHSYKMVYVPEIQVYHAHQLSLTKFWRQHFNYGCGAFYFHSLRAFRSDKEIKVEPISFYFRLLTHPLRQQSNQPGLILSLLLFVSQVANVAGFFYCKIKQELFVWMQYKSG